MFYISPAVALRTVLGLLPPPYGALGLDRPPGPPALWGPPLPPSQDDVGGDSQETQAMTLTEPRKKGELRGGDTWLVRPAPG
jgi:hypothetical protein